MDNAELRSLLRVPEAQGLSRYHCALESFRARGGIIGKTVELTIRWEERFIAAWESRIMERSDTILIPKTDVCLHLCGVRQAKKPQVRAVLLDRFGVPSKNGEKMTTGTKKNPSAMYGVVGDHQVDALAVAVVAWDRMAQEAKGKEKA